MLGGKSRRRGPVGVLPCGLRGPGRLDSNEGSGSHEEGGLRSEAGRWNGKHLQCGSTSFDEVGSKKLTLPNHTSFLIVIVLISEFYLNIICSYFDFRVQA